MAEPLRDAEVRAILALLEGEDDATAALIQEQMLARSPADLARLEAASQDAGERARRRVLAVLGESRERLTETLFDQLRPGPDGDLDLEEGTFLLARCAYPDAPMLPYHQELDRLAAALQRTLPADREPAAVLDALAALLQAEGFRGNAEDYYDPENSYVNRVLERRLGIPISLCAIVLLLGRRLRLPLAGVGMPGHFVVKYTHGEGEVLVDPFHGGRVLPREEAASFLRAAGYGFVDDYLAPVNNRQILTRMARNLAVIYERRDDRRMRTRVEDFLAVLTQRR